MLKFLDPSRNRYAGLIFAICVLCGPIGLIIASWAGWNAHVKQPLPPDSYVRLNEIADQVELFGDQFLRLALTGNGKQDRQTLASKMVDPRGVSLPEVPWNITSTKIVGIARVAVEADSAQWEVVMEVGYTPPGTGTIMFNNMLVAVLSSGGAYKAAALPRLVEKTVVPMEVGPGYTIDVNPDGGIGSTVKAFLNTYYVTDKNGAAPGGRDRELGRYVTGTFTGRPVSVSPFTSATVTAIRARAALPMKPKPADSVDILATVQGGASEKTWLTMQVPMRLVFTTQKQWAVSEISEAVEVGKIVHR